MACNTVTDDELPTIQAFDLQAASQSMLLEIWCWMPQ
jgi:hypothetical protein